MTDYTGTDIYCDLIIPRKIDIQVVKETDNILAFYHTKPYWPTHIVIIPKHHVDSFVTLDLKNSIATELLEAIQEIASSTTAKYGSSRILTNLGEYQDSKHLHFHISNGKPLMRFSA